MDGIANLHRISDASDWVENAILAISILQLQINHALFMDKNNHKVILST